jgi:hypothetical protein
MAGSPHEEEPRLERVLIPLDAEEAMRALMTYRRSQEPRREPPGVRPEARAA